MNLQRKPCVLGIIIVLLASIFVPQETPARSVDSPQEIGGKPVIVLDPGHGGHDLGAVGPNGLSEKRVTLALAQRINQLLSSACSVRLTRDGDYWIDIEERTAHANRHRGDLFISLHASGSFSHNAQGMAIFLFAPASPANLKPEKEQGALETEESLRRWDQVQSAHTASSRRLGDLLQKRIMTIANAVDIGIHEAPILLLMGADMPAVLIEIGYVTHPAYEKELEDVQTIADLAHAITEGIKVFLGNTSGRVTSEGMVEETVNSGRGAAW